MSLDKQDLVFTSLMGNELAKSLPKYKEIQNDLINKGLLTVPFLDPQGSDGLWKADRPYQNQFFPLTFQDIDTYVTFVFPYEPIITISGKNNIVKRSVAKQSNYAGTIKEHWTRDDYQITITGVLMGSVLKDSLLETFPIIDFQMLMMYLTKPRAIRVFCEPLQLMGINYIVIEDYSFPFTKGENVQAYEIKAVSDTNRSLLMEIDL